MANDGDGEGPGFKPDVPMSTALVPTTPAERRAMLARLSGEIPANEVHFYCTTCAEDKTLSFDPDEMQAFGGNPKENYGGPCWNCKCMTLTPFENIEKGAFKSVHEMAAASRQKEYGQAADVFIDKLSSRMGDIVMGAGVAAAGTDGAAPPPAAPPGEKGPSRDHLPDAGDVDLSDLKPRR